MGRSGLTGDCCSVCVVSKNEEETFLAGEDGHNHEISTAQSSHSPEVFSRDLCSNKVEDILEPTTFFFVRTSTVLPILNGPKGRIYLC